MFDVDEMERTMSGEVRATRKEKKRRKKTLLWHLHLVPYLLIHYWTAFFHAKSTTIHPPLSFYIFNQLLIKKYIILI